MKQHMAGKVIPGEPVRRKCARVVAGEVGNHPSREDAHAEGADRAVRTTQRGRS